MQDDRIATWTDRYARYPEDAVRHKARFESAARKTPAGTETRMVNMYDWNMATDAERHVLWEATKPTNPLSLRERDAPEAQGEGEMPDPTTMRAALLHIATSKGIYGPKALECKNITRKGIHGAQALEYKNIARQALGMELL